MKSDSIILRTKKANKTYNFIDSGNPEKIADFWYQNSIEGKILFLVFYTQTCRYSKCLGCNLPSIMSQHYIDFRFLMKQVDFVFEQILENEKKPDIKKIIVSNNGSVLDEDTFSTTALIYLLAKIKMECMNVETVTLETRTEYVDIEELEVLSRALIEGKKPTTLEIAIGFEAFNDEIRNDIFMKGLTIETFEKLAKNIQFINNRFTQKYPEKYRKIKLKTYFMQKPVSKLDEYEAIEDIKNAIDYLHGIAEKYEFEINMHLNPTYVAKGTVLEEDFKAGKFSPPLLKNVAESILHGENKNLTFYIGLNDEGLALPGGSFIREGNTEDLAWAEKLEVFNSTQNYDILK